MLIRCTFDEISRAWRMKKSESFVNKKHYLFLALIFIAALALRLWHLDKAEGMWNDEYFTWAISIKDFPQDFYNAIRGNCHMPLYYLFLKCWMFFFGQDDYILRLSSVFFGMLSVIAMYFSGREYKDENTGLFCAFFTSISSFAIYYSQEIRIYSMLFFLSAMTIYFGIRLLKNQDKLNYIFYALFNFLVLITHTIGFVFVVFNVAALTLFEKRKGRKSLSKTIIAMLCATLLFLPFVPLLLEILTRNTGLQQWWSGFSWGKTGYMLSDYFSPVLTNLVNSPPEFLTMFYNDGVLSLGNIMFAFVPLLICILGILRSLIKPKKTEFYLLLTAFATFLTVVIAAVAGKLVFVTKYTIEIYPILILLAVSGLLSFKNKALKIVLLSVFFITSIFYIVVANTSAVKLTRSEGNNIVAVGLREMNIRRNDTVLFLYYPKSRFDKYFKKDEYLKTYSIDKFNYSYKLFVQNGKINEDKNFRIAALSKPANPLLYDFLNVLKKGMKKHDKLAVVNLKTVSFLDENILKSLTSDTSRAEKVPVLFLVFSYVKNNVIAWGIENLKPVGIYEKGSWQIFVFEKV